MTEKEATKTRTDSDSGSDNESTVMIVAQSAGKVEKQIHYGNIFPYNLPNGMKNGIASGLAAAVAKTLLQPLDTIKTVQQAKRFGVSSVQAFMNLIEQRGIGGLWAGLGITVLGSSPSVAVYFGVYSSSRTYLVNLMPTNQKLLAVAIAATIGNTVASVLRVPYEVLKQRMQNGEYKSTWEAFIHSWKVAGPFGLFDNGKLLSQIIRDVPYAIVTLVSYEVLQSQVRKHSAGGKKRNDESMNTITTNKKGKDALCGSIAGGLGSLLTTPMDVVKTRMMTNSIDGVGISSYHGIKECFARILKEEGSSAFWVGAGPRLLHKIPANGLFFLCYEWFRVKLGVI